MKKIIIWIFGIILFSGFVNAFGNWNDSILNCSSAVANYTWKDFFQRADGAPGSLETGQAWTVIRTGAIVDEHLAATAAGNDMHVWFDITGAVPTGNTTFQIDINRTALLTEPSTTMYITDDSFTGEVVRLCTFDADGTFTVWNDTTGGSYTSPYILTANKVYTCRAEINWTSKNVTIYLNDTYVARTGLRGVITPTRVSLRGFNAQKGAVDNLLLTSNFSRACPSLPPSFSTSTLSNYNLTSDGGSGDILDPFASTDNTPTFTFNTDSNANCSVGLTNQNYTDMTTGTTTRDCAGGDGTTSHTCTLINADKLNRGTTCVYFSCIQTPNGVEGLTSSSGCINATVYDINLYLENINNSIDLETKTNISINVSTECRDCNFCLEIEGINQTCFIGNTTNLNFWYVVNTTLKNFSNGKKAVNLTANGNITYIIDNRTDINSIQINLTGFSSPENITIGFNNGTNKIELNGYLKNNSLIQTNFKWRGNEYSIVNISFSQAGVETIYLNVTSSGTNRSNFSFFISGFEIDSTNTLNFMENFTNKTHLNSSQDRKSVV